MEQNTQTQCPKPNMTYLLKLKEEKDKEQKRINLAIFLDICPVCGCKIINKPVELFNPPKSYFFGLIKRYSRTWDFRKVCSNDKNHYEVKEDYHSYDM